MDIKKLGIICLILILRGLNTNAQYKVKEIKVGDKLPNLIISGIFDKTYKKINLKSLYKDKVLIIDFWNTECPPCLEEMNNMDSLKRKNPGKFNVLSVTKNSEAKVQHFFSRAINRDINHLQLVIATGDKQLNRLFPHKYEPHNLWIDKNGVVKAITASSELTNENILSFANGDNMAMLRAKKDKLHFDPLKEFRLTDSSVTYSSMIAPYIDGVSGMNSIDRQSRNGEYVVLQYFLTNSSIQHLYWQAYYLTRTYKPNLIAIQTTDSLKFMDPKYNGISLKATKYKNDDEWAVDNTYCYALKLPYAVPEKIFSSYMLNDLGRQFNIRYEIENRQIKCNVITKTNGEKLIESKPTGDNQFQVFEVQTNKKFIFKNAKIKDVADYLSQRLGRALPNPFVIDIEKKDDILFDLELDLTNEKNVEDGISPEIFFRKLSDYGYRFKKEIHSYPILVLYDLNKGPAIGRN